jgi:hypothetical protein
VNTETGKSTPSVTFTALLWLGMLIALSGLLVTLLGTGHAVEFSAKIGDIEIGTTSAGLALLALGLFVDGFVATRLPASVSVFEVRKPTILESIAAKAMWILGAAVLAFLVCALSLRH